MEMAGNWSDIQIGGILVNPYLLKSIPCRKKIANKPGTWKSFGLTFSLLAYLSK